MLVGAATFASALATELMGLHYIIGAFLIGAVMPVSLRAPILDRLQVMSVALLMPFFFTLTGMRTLIDLNSAVLLEVFVLTTGAASFGIIGGTAVAARLFGERWSTAFGLGWLLQSKGLTELIVLSVLLDAHIISPIIFSAMILMALVTTALAMPLARLTLARADEESGRRRPCRAVAGGADLTWSNQRRLAPISLSSGAALLRYSKQRLVTDDPPSADRAVILDRQFGLDHPEAIEQVIAHRDIDRLAKLSPSVGGQVFVEQTQVRIQDIVGRPRMVLYDLDDLPQESGIFEL